MLNITSLLQDTGLRHQEFPVTSERIFFAHAGVCPLPYRTAEAIRTYATNATLNDQEEPILPHLLHSTRETVSKWLGVASDEIAMVGPTTMGLNMVASGLQFQRGDNVVIYLDDYPSNVYPWLALANRGVQVRFINARNWGRVKPFEILEQVDEQTRLVAMSSCHFITGWRLDYTSLAKELDSLGIPFCLDAIQTLGAFSTPLQHVAFMAADSHKWMLGPCGAGIFYVRKDWQERLRPSAFGWNNVRCPGFVAKEVMELKSGAHRYEAGSYNWMGMAGMKASIELLQEIGQQAISNELLRKRQILATGLITRGFDVLEPNIQPLNGSGIVSFKKADSPMSTLHESLTQRGVITSLRTNRAGINWIRLSPHFYNSDDEIECFFHKLDSV